MAETDVPQDRTARARVRDAAIGCFAEAGVAATSVRTVAATAGVSPGLVLHHFGSKDGLRSACDDHVAATIRDQKSAAMAAGSGLDPVAALRAYDEGPPLLAYLARTLVDGSPAVADLIDELVDDAEAYLAEGEATGLVAPTADPRGRAAVLAAWSLGGVVLHEHLRRLLAVDVLGPTADQGRYVAVVTELLTGGVLTPAATALLADVLPDAPEVTP